MNIGEATEEPGIGSEGPQPGEEPGIGSEGPQPGEEPGIGSEGPQPGEEPGIGSEDPQPGEPDSPDEGHRISVDNSILSQVPVKITKYETV